jgi:hypothetical protein
MEEMNREKLDGEKMKMTVMALIVASLESHFRSKYILHDANEVLELKKIHSHNQSCFKLFSFH